ncbi:hypothetical protein HBB16_21660 [Pseudonocardia sp. MCCB 268]|nr:hypothetical protein [Pseudonocardia cytotoxica]
MTAGPLHLRPRSPLPGPARPAIAWGPCTDPSLVTAGAECGFSLCSPRPRRPRRQTIRLALRIAKVKQTTTNGIDSTSWGTPCPRTVTRAPSWSTRAACGPGLGLSRLGGAVPKDAGSAYDWIGFDPRGRRGQRAGAELADPGYGGYAPAGLLAGERRGSGLASLHEGVRAGVWRPGAARC